MLKIKYNKDVNGNVTGCTAEDKTAGYTREFTTPVTGGLWINGKQVVGTCDFTLRGSTENQRRQLRKYVEYMQAEYIR